MVHFRLGSVIRNWGQLLALLFLWAALSNPAWSQTGVDYVVDASDLSNHTLTVTATLPPEAFQGSHRELALPVWTPGSYKVRDYSRFLSSIRPLNPGATIRKSSKNRWVVEGVPAGEAVKVQYDVYGHDLTVRTNYFTPELALIVGAGTFLAPAPLQSEEMKKLPYRVQFLSDKPVYSGLPGEGPNFVAGDYVELLDSPFLLGDLSSHAFTAGLLPHQLIQAGDPRYWDTTKSLKDTQKLIETVQKFWGEVPYQRYLIMNLITDTRGGLEHRNSTVVMTNRFATEKRKDYLGWLSLIAHEYFHTWNVKRLRPNSLRPFDFEQENYTRSLWVAEGITSYYDDLLVRRAGLSTRKEYLKALSEQLNRLLETPGRRHITLTDASFDAWIRLYQPTDDLHNSNISYYNKGAVVAWLLDTEIRQRTQGKKSLDDLMREAYRTFQGEGFSEGEFRQLASRVAGSDLNDFFQKTLDSTEELPLEKALEYWHLEWKAEDDDQQPYLGVDLAPGSRAVVSKVFEGSPAALAGLSPGDELLAIDDLRLPESSPLSILEYTETGREYRVVLSRLGRISEKKVVLTAPPHSKSELTFQDDGKGYQNRWNSWLGPESESDS